MNFRHWRTGHLWEFQHFPTGGAGELLAPFGSRGIYAGIFLATVGLGVVFHCTAAPCRLRESRKWGFAPNRNLPGTSIETIETGGSHIFPKDFRLNHPAIHFFGTSIEMETAETSTCNKKCRAVPHRGGESALPHCCGHQRERQPSRALA